MAERTLVVGAAVLRDGRVLAARRLWPEAAAGRWELPGGKVETGESPDDALVREIAEELDVEIVVQTWLDGASPIRDSLELRVATTVLASGSAEPVLREHDALRWLGPDELGEVDWLEPDRPFLAQLREILCGRMTP